MHMTPRSISRFGLAAAAVILGWAVFSFQAGVADELAPSDTTLADSSDMVFPQGDAKKGKKLFSAKACFACHKANGSGGFKVGGNPTPDWRDSKRMNDPQFDNAYLRDCITNGKLKSGIAERVATASAARHCVCRPQPTLGVSHLEPPPVQQPNSPPTSSSFSSSSSSSSSNGPAAVASNRRVFFVGSW